MAAKLGIFGRGMGGCVNSSFEVSSALFFELLLLFVLRIDNRFDKRRFVLERDISYLRIAVR